MTEHAVVIAGGGPTGLMLAAELALAGVDVAIVEPRADQALAGSRAGGLHARTLEVLDQRGVAERFVAAGQRHPAASFALTRLDLADLPTRFPFVLALWQEPIERLLAAWAAELGVRWYRRREVAGFTQDDAGVEVALADGDRLRARYLVGCDGGRSLIRKQAGIDFAGWDASTSYLLAEASVREPPPVGFRRQGARQHAIGALDGARVRIVLEEEAVGGGDEPTVAELHAALIAAYATDFGLHDVTWVSRFTDAARQATAYRDRRVLLAGDAAHVHSPIGGQGLNLGVQDAVNLGWKLAQVVHGTAPAALLDSYQAERHPIGARVLRTTLAQTALRRADARTEALQAIVADLLRADDARLRYAALMTGLDVHYELGPGHPLLGRRMPDLALDRGRVYPLLHAARPVLLALAGDLPDLGPWAARVRAVQARCDEPWVVPAIGAVPAPAAVLIRPDGHVAWVGDGGDAGLRAALITWFGPA